MFLILDSFDCCDVWQFCLIHWQLLKLRFATAERQKHVSEQKWAMVDFSGLTFTYTNLGSLKISYFQTDKQQETSQKNKSKDATGLNIVSINYQLPESEICYMYLSKLGSTTDIK